MTQPPRKGSLLVIFLTVFIDLLGFGIVLPLLPIYGKQFAADLGYSTSQVGWVTGLLMSSFSAMQFLFLPLWGRISDRVGRRPILLLGLAGSTFSYALFGLATTWRSLFWLFVARAGAGIAGATISTAQAYIADTTTKEQRAKGMALIGAAFALGFTVGPMLGSVSLLVGERAEFSPWPGYVAAIFSGVAMLLAIWLLPESWEPRQTSKLSLAAFLGSLVDTAALRSALSTASIGLLLLTNFIAVFSFANFESTLSVQIKQLSEASAAGQTPSGLLSGLVSFLQRQGYEHRADIDLVLILIAFCYLGIVLTLAQGYLVRRLAGHVPDRTLLLAGGATGVIGFALLALAANQANVGLLLGAMAVEVIGFALMNPALQSLLSRRTDPAYQGGILGISQSCASLGRILGPVFGLRLFVQASSLPYWSAAAIMAIAVVLMSMAVRRGGDWEGEPSK